MGATDLSSATTCIGVSDSRILELDGQLRWNDLPRSYRLLSTVFEMIPT